MRKITKLAIDAFMNDQAFSLDNTKVVISEGIVALELYSNRIAYKHEGLNHFCITDAGWKTNTTKERLNALPGVSINQKKGEWYLNGDKWAGEARIIGLGV